MIASDDTITADLKGVTTSHEHALAQFWRALPSNTNVNK